MADLDLSSWRVAFNGAERIRPATMRQFVETFSPFGFRDDAFFPCYGLGEATLMVTGGPALRRPVLRSVSTEGLRTSRILPPAEASDVTELAGCGQAFPDCCVVVVSQTTGLPVGDDEIGHVLVAGANVTQGYFGRTALDEDAFVELRVKGTTQRFLRTGDLGFLSSNELFITGRSREMMIFRGRNYYPEDLEEQVWKSHDALQSGGAVAFSIDHDDKPSLIIAAEIQRSSLRSNDLARVIGVIRQTMVESFGISPLEVLLLRPATIPRTTSGKPRRLLLRDHYVDKSLEFVKRG